MHFCKSSGKRYCSVSYFASDSRLTGISKESCSWVIPFRLRAIATSFPMDIVYFPHSYLKQYLFVTTYYGNLLLDGFFKWIVIICIIFYPVSMIFHPLKKKMCRNKNSCFATYWKIRTV